MKRVLTIFIILAAVSIALMVRERKNQEQGDLATSFSEPTANMSDRISTSAAAPARAASAPGKLSSEDTGKLQVLNEILTTKNDNDPRMDCDLKNLSDPLKSAMMAKYKELPIESRNERGTVVFLIGRNLNRPEDFAFLSDVLREPKCLSLADCKSASGAGTAGDETGANEVTLAYPQWVAIRFLERSLDGPLSGSAVQSLQAATHSPDRAISQRANELLQRVKGHG